MLPLLTILSTVIIGTHGVELVLALGLLVLIVFLLPVSQVAKLVVYILAAIVCVLIMASYIFVSS